MTTIKYQKPSLIYKYTSLKVAKIIATDLTLKFSTPSEFNDPFDCDIDLVSFDFSKETDNYVQYEINELKRIHKNNPYIIEKLNNQLFLHSLYKNGQIEKIKSSKICCFSLKQDIILMWSHYADKHTGVCLEFNNDAINKFVTLTENDYSEGVVGYKAEEKINYISENRLVAMYKLFLSKSKSWSHEEEYRMFTINNKPEIQKFYPEFLSAVYFGLRVSDNETRQFMEICKSSGLHGVKYHKASKGILNVQFTPCN